MKNILLEIEPLEEIVDNYEDAVFNCSILQSFKRLKFGK